MNFEKYIRISKLIAKSLLKDINEKEKKILSDWLKEDDSNKTLYSGLEERQDWSQQQHHLDKERIWQHIFNEINPEQKKKIFPFKTILKYAAAAIIVFGIGIGAWNIANDIKKKEIAQAHKIKPGTSKARLILNNGKIIVLGVKDTVLNTTDKNISIKIDSGKIEYKRKNKKKKTAELHTLKMEKGEEYELTLADGTIVKLNSNTELRFPTEFSEDERRVYLKGEALFKVKGNESKPFIVHANGMNVQVMGTEFNVSAYEDDDFIHTTLIEGSVRVHEQLSGNNQTTILKPSQQAYLNKDGVKKLEVKIVDTDLYASWAKGKFVFKEEPLHSIFKKLSRWYNIEVFYDDAEAKYTEFSAICPRFEHCETILELMEKTNSVEFEVSDNTILVKSKR